MKQCSVSSSTHKKSCDNVEEDGNVICTDLVGCFYTCVVVLLLVLDVVSNKFLLVVFLRCQWRIER